MDLKCISLSTNKAFDYSQYRKIVSEKLKNGLSTGPVQSEELWNYSKLNESRMNRLEKTMIVVDEVKQKLESLENKYTWLVLSEGWCGDAAQILPILNKMAQISENIDLKILFRDENEELMNLFLTNGGKSIPKLIIIDQNTQNVVADWGPRPKGAIKLVNDYKKEFGIFDETVKINLQKWYLEDKGVSTQKEIVGLMQ